MTRRGLLSRPRAEELHVAGRGGVTGGQDGWSAASSGDPSSISVTVSARFWVNDPAIRFRRAVAMQTRAREHEGEIEMHRVANRIANFGVRTAALVIERAVRWVTA